MEEITAAEIVGLRPRIQIQNSSNHSRALAYEAPPVVQTMGSTPVVISTLRVRLNEHLQIGDGESLGSCITLTA
jgi:hypothetical protein